MTDRKDGLRGVVAGTSEISSVDGSAGKLAYRGIDINDLASHASFEEVAYLIWHDELPTPAQLDKLVETLNESRQLPGPLIDMVTSLPAGTVAMDALRTSVSMLATFDPDVTDNSVEATRRKSVRLLAQIPTVVATFARVADGHDPPSPTDGPIARSFLTMLTGEPPQAEEIRALDTLLVLQADHEFNASTFTARVIAATLSDLHSAIAGAIGALRGPLHGGANQAVMDMLISIGEPRNAEQWILDKLTSRDLVMGFGHPVYKTADPRALILRKMSKDLSAVSGHAGWHEISQIVETVMMRERGLNPNVDFYAATVYASLGILPNLFTPIFAVSRTSGWTAHVLEQLSNNRIIRPRAEYVGHTDRPFVPLEKRI